jgi:hypothetical protein
MNPEPVLEYLGTIVAEIRDSFDRWREAETVEECSLQSERLHGAIEELEATIKTLRDPKP